MKNKFLNMVEPGKIAINEETLSLDHIDDEAVAGRTNATVFCLENQHFCDICSVVCIL